jgi:hypothetical protein
MKDAADEFSTFLADVRAYGKARAMTRLEHRERKRIFAWRQFDLAALVVMMLCFHAASGGHMLFAVMAQLAATVGKDEAWRMRTRGRTYPLRMDSANVGTFDAPPRKTAPDA